MGKKLSLKLDYTPEYSLLGICTPLSDFKLAWNINNMMGLSLKKKDNFVYSHNNINKNEPFSIYYYNNNAIDMDYFVISNRSENSFLIPEYKECDYFFLLKCCDSAIAIGRMIGNIKDIENVQTVFLIEPKTIKHINNFLGDLELHLL
jgi:hypothetical protein